MPVLVVRLELPKVKHGPAVGTLQDRRSLHTASSCSAVVPTMYVQTTIPTFLSLRISIIPGLLDSVTDIIFRQ